MDLNLTDTQKRIAALASRGDLTQAQIAKRIGCNPSTVSRTIAKLIKLGMLRPSPKTGYVCRWYEGSQDLRAGGDLIVARPHNILLKFKILHIEGDLSFDPVKVGYYKSWSPRGGKRHKFLWGSSAPGSSNITIDIHPNTIVAYPDGRQELAAPSLETLYSRIILEINEAVISWVRAQFWEGCKIEINKPELGGELVSRPHVAFTGSEDLIDRGVTLPGWWTDHSHGVPEVETDQFSQATTLDESIRILQKAAPMISELPQLTRKVSEIHDILSKLSNGEKL